MSAVTAWFMTAAVTMSLSLLVVPPELFVSASLLASNDNIGIQRRYQEVVVSFEIEQTNATTDQVSIIFTNAPVDLKSPQTLENGIVQQFVFSGRDYPHKRPVSFSRRIADKSFLDCKFIRIVNRGTNRWFPSTISMTVDGQRILDRLSMYPRKGANPSGGIERWGMSSPTFWETDLQRFKSRAS